MPRVTTKAEDRQFLSATINENLLELALDWVASHMRPDDVFGEKDWGDWAISQGYSRE